MAANDYAYGPFRRAMAALQCIVRDTDETPDDFQERAHVLLIAMAPYHEAAALYHIETLGYAHVEVRSR